MQINTYTPEQLARIRFQLIHAVTDYDKRQSRRSGYNRYALPQYCAAVNNIMADLDSGADLRAAVCAALLGRLLSRALRELGLPDFTIAERQAQTTCYTPAAAR